MSIGTSSEWDTPVPAVNARGDVLLVWAREGSGLLGRYRPSGGPWGPGFRVTPGTPSAYSLGFATAVYRHGDAVAAWSTGGDVKVRRMTAP